MRRIGFAVLLTLLLAIAACAEATDDDATDDVAEPEPTPTEEIAEDPTPEPTATPVPEDEDDATLDDEDDAVEPEDDAIDDDEATDDTAALSELVDEITENVVEMRGLELLEDIDLSIMTHDELRDYLEDSIELEQHEIDRDWLLRLIPDPDEDVEQMLIDLQVADVGGFYDPETGETVVVSDDDELSAMEEVILAHEIVHALQDQHFDLGRLESLLPDGDAALSFRSMLEGDAVISQQQYAETYLDEERQMEYQQDAMAAQQDEETMAAIEDIPSYYLETFVFPYSAGPEFMSQVVGDDLNNMDEYIENPPVSTYQVINSQAYIAGELDDPVDVEMPDLGDRLGGTWEMSEEGTFGAFTLFMILYENEATDPVVAFDGWSGDWYEFYISEDDQSLVAVSTVWEDEDQAAAYEDQLLETMADYDEEDGVWMSDDRYHVVIQDGDSLDLMSSTDPDALLDAADMQ